LCLAAGNLAAGAWRRGGDLKVYRAATWFAIPALAAVLIPPVYHLIAGR
jgi:hypothetical protein